MSEAGKDVQVLKVNDDHSYTVTKDLSSILLRDDVKDLPVVVVSAVGPFRGGKSFLLNFFLRYLSSPDSAISDGTWIGEDDEPLTGFSWRGGSERNTKGIRMWSEPIKKKLPSGEEVAVIVIDTQGTFDMNSTTRDNITIFAMSTLMSSVQIYNLRGNITENNLQHFQFFTEYGKLVETEHGKAMQMIEFLVRDWAYPEDYPYGAAGGDALLETRLKVTEHMSPELRSLRENLKSSFEIISGFLMPHPGMKVIKSTFQGQPKDISQEFKDALGELAESLFEPGNLMVKKINGNEITAGQLYTYIQTYAKIFGSEELPTAHSVVEATKEAAVLTAMNNARLRYEAYMDRECGTDKPSLPTVTILNTHQLAVDTAKETFTAKRLMASADNYQVYLTKLTKSLNERFQQYLKVNAGKLAKAIDDALKAYDDTVNNVTKDKPLCLHPADLEKLHKDAKAAAINSFSENRGPAINGIDHQRQSFVENLESRYEKLRADNDRNNQHIVQLIAFEYWTRMQPHVVSNPPLSDHEFKKKHDTESAKIIENFEANRNIHSTHSTDEYKTSLNAQITTFREQLEIIRNSSSKLAIHNAMDAYDKHMSTAADLSRKCSHPEDLVVEHTKAKCKALYVFNNTPCDQLNEADPEQAVLMNIITHRYEDLSRLNVVANESAVLSAYHVYTTYMDKHCEPSVVAWLTIMPAIEAISNKPKFHNDAKSEALEHFYSKRNSGPYHMVDPYVDNLQRKMRTRYRVYFGTLLSIAKFIGDKVGFSIPENLFEIAR